MAESTTNRGDEDVWTRSLDLHGEVRFGLAPWKVALNVLVLAGMTGLGIGLALAPIDAEIRVPGAILALGLLPAGWLPLIDLLSAERRGLIVDRVGIHVRRRYPLTIPWKDVIAVGAYRAQKRGATMVMVMARPEVFESYRAALPWYRRPADRLANLGRRFTLTLHKIYSAPAVQLAAWLESQVDRRSPVPDQVILMPAEDVGPLWASATLRNVDPSRLPISSHLADAVAQWNERAAPVLARSEEATERPEGWPALAEEGRELQRRLAEELHGRVQVLWFEDDPE